MVRHPVGTLLLYLAVVATYAIVFLDSAVVQRMGQEDGPIENLGAFYFLIAAVFFLVCYARSAGRGNDFWVLKTKRNIFYLLLGVLFIVCMGEEISWGQRIFGWGTPETWAELNAQKETNFHNLWYFQTRNPDGSRKSFLELFLNMSRLFSMFWFAYCVLVPLVDRASRKARALFARVALPICPFWIGFLFLANFGVFQVAVRIFADPANSVDGALNELKETNYALAFMVLGIWEWVRSRRWNPGRA